MEQEIWNLRYELPAPFVAAVTLHCQRVGRSPDSVLCDLIHGLCLEELREVRAAWRGGRSRGFIYLMRAPSDGLSKIGMAQNPFRRLQEMGGDQSGYKLIHAFPVPDMPRYERAAHLMFAAKRVDGEWFKLTKSDAKRFCALNADSLTPAKLSFEETPGERKARMEAHRTYDGIPYFRGPKAGKIVGDCR